MRLAHARPGDTLERFDGADWIVIRIDAAFAETLPDGTAARFVDGTFDEGGAVQRVRADTDPHDWRRVDPEADARLGFAALAGNLPPAPPPPTEGQMIAAAAKALGVRMVTRIPGDDEPLPDGVTVRVVGAAANGGSRNRRPRGRR